MRDLADRGRKGGEMEAKEKEERKKKKKEEEREFRGVIEGGTR